MRCTALRRAASAWCWHRFHTIPGTPSTASTNSVMSLAPAPAEIPFHDLRPAYRELAAELDSAYRRVMESGRYILGEELEAFESEFARYCEVAHCVGVANGLDALCLILRAAGIGPGDEVLVPSNTYIATWLAVSH